MHVEAWGLNDSLYLPYVMHGRPSVAASFSLRPQDSLWDGAHDARLTGDVVGEILGGKVDRADWSGVPDDPRTGARPRHKLSLPYLAFSSCPFAQVDEDDATRISYALPAQPRKPGGSQAQPSFLLSEPCPCEPPLTEPN